MQSNRVILTLEAIYDITDIAEYIENKFGIERADSFQNDIQKQFSSLKSVGSGFGRTQILYQNYTIYKKPFPPSIIFYIIKEPEKEIHILRVLREERNWKKILKTTTKHTYP